MRDLLQGGGGSRLTDKERQLRVINKKTENYQRLNDRIREDNPGIEDAVAAKRATATGDRQRRRSRSPRGREKRSYQNRQDGHYSRRHESPRRRKRSPSYSSSSSRSRSSSLSAKPEKKLTKQES